MVDQYFGLIDQTAVADMAGARPRTGQPQTVHLIEQPQFATGAGR